MVDRMIDLYREWGMRPHFIYMRADKTTRTTAKITKFEDHDVGDKVHVLETLCIRYYLLYPKDYG